MNKQEILDRIQKAEQELAEAKKQLEEVDKRERWMPKKGDCYWVLSTYHTIHSCMNTLSDDDRKLITNFNFFKTKEQAQKEADKILVRRQLEAIAEELGKPTEEDFKKEKGFKFYIYFDNNHLYQNFTNSARYAGVTYCLSGKFLDEAKERIGEEKLIEYCREI